MSSLIPESSILDNMGRRDTSAFTDVVDSLPNVGRAFSSAASATGDFFINNPTITKWTSFFIAALAGGSWGGKLLDKFMPGLSTSIVGGPLKLALGIAVGFLASGGITSFTKDLAEQKKLEGQEETWADRQGMPRRVSDPNSEISLAQQRGAQSALQDAHARAAAAGNGQSATEDKPAATESEVSTSVSPVVNPLAGGPQ